MEIKIHHDSEPSDPRKEFDYIGHMACFHSRYTLGDKDAYDNLIDYCKKHNKTFSNIQSDTNNWEWNYDESEQINLTLETAEKLGCEILLLYMYEHGGITISSSPYGCPWDSGTVGFIYI